MNTSEVLYLAADLIEQRGWGVGNEAMRADGSPVCLEGAIGAAAGIEPNFLAGEDDWIIASTDVQECPAYEAVSRYLADRPDDEWAPSTQFDRELWGWNDQVGRTASEVVGVLRAAAVVEAARESQPSVAVA